MVYAVRSLDQCSVECYYARAMNTLCMSYGFVTILVHKSYIALQLCYDAIRYLFLTPAVLILDIAKAIQYLLAR